ncbi:MAG TPA: ABC transporter ATP-binding protein [Candidatus Saccharimonadales bacterium]|nr:ABC transporter ATP-binding protein [Candidatus Saccharimonadales bacterium]
MKKNINKQSIRLFWEHASRYPFRAYGLLILVPATIFLHQFLPPLISADILNRLSTGNFVPGDLWSSFGDSLIWYAIISFLGGMMGWRLVIYFLWSLYIRVSRDIHQRIFGHLLTMSATFHANRFGGSLVSQANNLANAYGQFANTTIFQLIPLVVSLAFTAIILLPRAPLFVGVLFVISAIYIVVAILTTKKLRTLNAIVTEAGNTRTGQLADTIANIMAVKSFAASATEDKRFAKANRHWAQSERNVMVETLKRQTQFAGVGTVMDVSALGLAVASVVVFKADIATVFLVLSYTGNVLWKLWDFSNSAMREYNTALGNAKSMVEILGKKPLVRDPVKPEDVRINKGDIALQHVTYAHADSRKDALFTDLSLHIQAGEKIGLVGHSGSGKTTLTKLLLRFSDIDAGTITIDGQNIAKITQEDLRRNIAYVPQEPLLFHRTITENIAYGKPNATREEIEEAARRAHAAKFIAKLPRGYATEVGERGIKLSGGQRQRIAIARAILKDAPILLLDEATSALDSQSEKHIQAALWELMEGRTAIVIAHRLSTIQRMDRIIVLDDGAIVEQGSHDQLLARGGIYAELWAHQSGGFIEE